MVMATNSIAAIDPAMLRPGRFDLIIPVGAPDRLGREELAGEFLGACDAAAVAGQTEGFTPADFALAAQRAAQRAFERALAGGDATLHAEDCADAGGAHQAERARGGCRGVRRGGGQVRPALTGGSHR